MKFVVTMCFYFSFQLLCSSVIDARLMRAGRPGVIGSALDQSQLGTSHLVMALIGDRRKPCPSSSRSFQHRLFGFQLH